MSRLIRRYAYIGGSEFVGLTQRMTPIEPGQLQGIHVLLVEDNEDALYILESYFRHHGAMVTTAANGRDALAILRQITPHVIVSDITMPGISAFLVKPIDPSWWSLTCARCTSKQGRTGVWARSGSRGRRIAGSSRQPRAYSRRAIWASQAE
ncbi:MAG TPA: response regulator [Candidatus Acidoferrum sp.]|nr:response regulator [Candidatus Acidoferrum sp.]